MVEIAKNVNAPLVIPNPDPSMMTLDAIDRNVTNLERTIGARIDGMEKAVAVFQSDLTRVPTQLDRAAQALRDLTEARFNQVDAAIVAARDIALKQTESNLAVLGTRLAGMDKAIELLQRATDKMPEFIRDQVNQLHSLTDERFNSIDKDLTERDKRTGQSLDSINTQFAERDKRTEQLSLADKTAIAAALQAQKEAAGATNESNGAALAKMENNFTKQIEAGQALVQSVSRNLEDKLNDLKSRMDRGEGKSNVLDPAVMLRMEQLSASINELSRARDHGEGRSSAVDPAMSAEMSNMRSQLAILTASRDHIAGGVAARHDVAENRQVGASTNYYMLATVAVVFSVMISLATLFYNTMHVVGSGH